MSPSSMFSRGSRSPFVFWPSKISRSLQNHVTVLSCRKKYFVFQYHKLYLWFGLVTTLLLTNVNYNCHLIPWLPLGNQHEHGVDHWVAEPVFFNIFHNHYCSHHLKAAEAKLLMISGWTLALYSVASSTRSPYLENNQLHRVYDLRDGWRQR